MAEAMEEELFVTSPALFSKLLIRRFHVGSLKEKLDFCKTTTKALLKPQSELVALVTLRVPSVLTVPLLNLFLILSRGLSEMEVCSSVASTSSLGFPGGSLGWLGAS